MAKTPVIWNYGTAAKVAAAKEAKYGMPFVVVDAKDGGFHVFALAPAPVAVAA